MLTPKLHAQAIAAYVRSARFSRQQARIAQRNGYGGIADFYMGAAKDAMVNARHLKEWAK